MSKILLPEFILHDAWIAVEDDGTTCYGKSADLQSAGSLWCPETDCSVVLCHPGQVFVWSH